MKLDQKFVRHLLIQIILASSLAFIITSGLKLNFQTPRPCEFLETCPDTYSFPSRHTGVAFAAATILSLYIRKLPYRILFFVLAGLVGYWRIAIYYHTIYDIIGGAAIGIAVGFGVYYFYKKFHGAKIHRK